MDNPLTSSQAELEIERNFKHNVICNFIDGATYWFGFSFLSPAIILPLFLSRFTSNPILIGMIPFINTAFLLVPQLFTANWVKSRPVKKYFPVTLGLFAERVPALLFPVIALVFAKDQPGLTVTLTLVTYAWYCLGTGLVIVGWQDMIGKIIPVDRRGRFFGITNFAGTTTALAGSFVVTWVLAEIAFPYSYALAFGVAALFIFISWVSLAQTREPAVYSTQPPVSFVDHLRTLPAILRRDANFTRFLLSQIVISAGGMAAGFLAVYPAERWNMPDSAAGTFTTAMLLGQAGANIFFGFISDRRGHKIVLEIGALAAAAAFVLSLAATSPGWFQPVFFLRGVFIASLLMSGVSIPLEFSAPEDRPTYIGLANTIPGVASSVSPLIGGWLAAVAGYPFVFGVSAAIGALGLVLLRFLVREPRFHAYRKTSQIPSA